MAETIIILVRMVFRHMTSERRPKAIRRLLHVGQKRKCPGSRGTSVLPSGADIISLPGHVRLVPDTDLGMIPRDDIAPGIFWSV